MSLDPGAQQSAGVLITIGRVYEEVTATRRDIGVLTGNVGRALEQGADHETRLRVVERDGATKRDVADLERDHGNRLSAVERKIYGYAGAAAALGVGGGWLVAFVTKGH